jgi:hypothetical protein
MKINKNSLEIVKHRILHGEHINYWTVDGGDPKFSSVNFNLLAISKNMNHRTLEFKCNSRVKDKMRLPIDVIYSTKHGPLAVCTKRLEGKDVPIIEFYPEIIAGKENVPAVVITFKEDKVKNPTNKEEISDILAHPTDEKSEQSVRFLRLDNDAELEKDLIMYKDQGSTIFFNNMEYKLNFSTPAVTRMITEVTVVKSRFLVVETAESKDKKKISTYVFDMEAENRNSSHVLAKYVGCNLEKDNATYYNENWHDCPTHFNLSQMRFVNSHNLQENPSNFFFEFKKVVLDQQTEKSSGRIDVYLCQKSQGTDCDIVIKSWNELANDNAVRFTSSNYFLQITNSFEKNTAIVLIDGKNETVPNNTMAFEFFMSTKRYKSIPKSIFKINIPAKEENKDIFKYYFDEVSEVVYITGKNFSKAFRVDPIKFRIRFYEFNSTSVDKYTDQDAARNASLKEILDDDAKNLTNQNNFIKFELKFDNNRNVSHTMTYNNRTTLGEYIFWPHFGGKVSVDGAGNDETHVIQDSVPMGLPMHYDVIDLMRGSFIKLKTDSFFKGYQDISNSYLDPYRFKLTVKKPKFLEDFYFVDTEKSEKRKVYMIVSTKTDTLIYTGNRFPFSTDESLTLTYMMRDFRSLTDFYPINGTHGLAQVQEVIYTLNPFDETNTTTEVPSRGVNGVCNYSSLMFHDKLGPLHFCIYDQKTFYKRLLDDSKIEQLTITKEVQDVLKSLNRIRFLRYSDAFINHIFMFYTLNSEALKDTEFYEYTMFMAVFRIDHKADPSLVLVSKDQMPFDPKFDSNANIYALELAGARAIFLERSNVEKGEHRLGIMAIEKGKAPFILYHVPLPSKLLVEQTTRFILTNVPDENDIDLNQNSVMSVESKYYQICFKVINADTKDTMVVVFNPQIPIFSSLSIIELPTEYKVVDSGPFYIVSKDKRRTSLALLAAKTAKLDEDYMSKEAEMFVFMVTDMTPTLLFKPFKNTSVIIKPLNESNIWAANAEQAYNFNVSSNIYTEEKINENKQKNRADRLLLDTKKKKFKAKYALWGNVFDSLENSTNDKNMKVPITIKSQTYVNNLGNSKEDSELKDLNAFFIRVDPLKHIKGHIFNYTGQAESSIEDFMGIIKVLSPNLTTPIDVDERNINRLRNISEKQLGKIMLDSSCPNPVYNKTNTQIEDLEITLGEVRRCSPGAAHHFITSWEHRIWKLKGDKLLYTNKRFTNYKLSLNYVLHKQFVFYLQRKIDFRGVANITICRQDIGLLDKDNSDLIECTLDRSASIIFDSSNNLMSTTLSIEISPLAPFNESSSSQLDRYIITILHFNKPMSIYTQVEFYDMSFPSSKDKNAHLTQIGSIFVGSNNLKVSVSSSSKETSNVEVFMALIYYRWRQNTELTLMQDIIEVNYTKNYQTGVLGGSDKPSPKTEAADLQGFTPNPSVTNAILMKFATLLYSMSTKNTIMRAVVEHIRLWTPQKTLNPFYKDIFDDGKEVPILKIIVDFPNSNSFLLHSNIHRLRDLYHLNEKEKNSLVNKVLGGIEVNLTEYKVAPIENPFIGFLPNPENPDPVFIDDYYFIINNYQDKSYFYYYTLEPKKIKKYSELGTIRNIFGVNFSDVLDKNANTIFTNLDEKAESNYMRINLLMSLSDKPVGMTVMPNCNPNSYLEHCLLYLNTEEKMNAINFTSYVNIRVKTHKVASRNVSLSLYGKFGKTRNITLQMTNDPNSSYWKNPTHPLIILILLGVALALTIGTMLVVKQDVQMTLQDNNQILSRHSVMPITGLIMNFIENKVVPAEVSKEKEDYSESSEDSDEDPDHLKKKLLSNKKPPEIQEPPQKPKSVDPFGLKKQETIAPRSGQEFIHRPEEQNSDDDYANPLK